MEFGEGGTSGEGSFCVSAVGVRKKLGLHLIHTIMELWGGEEEEGKEKKERKGKGRRKKWRSVREGGREGG